MSTCHVLCHHDNAVHQERSSLAEEAVKAFRGLSSASRFVSIDRGAMMRGALCTRLGFKVRLTCGLLFSSLWLEFCFILPRYERSHALVFCASQKCIIYCLVIDLMGGGKLARGQPPVLCSPPSLWDEPGEGPGCRHHGRLCRGSQLCSKGVGAARA